MLPLSLTFDHRAVSGGEAARFLAAVKAALESRIVTLAPPKEICSMEDMFRFADPLRPGQDRAHPSARALGLKAIVVIDNVACGPAIGGVRMAPDVSVEECVRLARAMTLKNAAAGLPHGGGKSVIFGDPRMPPADKERVIRAFAGAIRDLVDYIPGPDMGTDERCMAWVQDEIGRAVGLPRVLGGIPLDEIGATGFGLVAAIEAAAPHCGLSLQGARVAVQGFGAVGRHAARFLAEKGAVLVAAADSSATLCRPGRLSTSRRSRATSWPAARSAIIRPGRSGRRMRSSTSPATSGSPPRGRMCCAPTTSARLQAKLVAQGANIPATAEAEAMLHARGRSGPARFHRQRRRRDLRRGRVSRRHRRRGVCRDRGEDRPQYASRAGRRRCPQKHAACRSGRTGRAAGPASGGLSALGLSFRRRDFARRGAGDDLGAGSRLSQRSISNCSTAWRGRSILSPPR